jgi:hypothetical protein
MIDSRLLNGLMDLLETTVDPIDIEQMRSDMLNEIKQEELKKGGAKYENWS